MPARIRDIKRALSARSIAVEEPSSGSHWKATNGQTTYPIPAPNGLKTEVSDVYVKGLCRAFGIDYQAFKREL